MHFQSLFFVPALLAAFATASPIKCGPQPDCPGDDYCRGAILSPLNATTLVAGQQFTFSYETNPNVITQTVTPWLSTQDRAPIIYSWDAITVIDGHGLVEAELTVPTDFVQDKELWLYGSDLQEREDGTTVTYASASIDVTISSHS